MFEKYSDRIYIQPPEHYTDRPNVGYIKGDKYTLMFEAGNSVTNAAQLMDRIYERGLTTPDFVAVSHWHWDHTFGMAYWKNIDVLTVAGRQTNDMLAVLSSWKWDDESMENRVKTGEDLVFTTEMIKREYPNRDDVTVTTADIVLDGRMTIDLGGVTCVLLLAKGPHSEDSYVCYIPEEKFVFLGDSNGKDLYGKPWHFDIEHEDDFMEETGKIPYDEDKVNEYISILETLDFTHCIGGHAGVMTKEELYRSFK